MALGLGGNEGILGRITNWADKRLQGKNVKGGKWRVSLEAFIISDDIFDQVEKGSKFPCTTHCKPLLTCFVKRCSSFLICQAIS